MITPEQIKINSMKFMGKEITLLDDFELANAVAWVKKIEDEHAKVGKHKKFENMPQPPLSDWFVQMKSAIEAQMSKKGGWS